MNVSTNSYPVPVLGNLDDVRGRFNTTFQGVLGHDTVILNYDIDISNRTIEELIERGDASFYIQVECPGTFFRRVYKSNDSHISIEIDAGDLRDKVTTKILVCANVTIPEYSPEGVDPDFEGEPSRVEPGDVIADGGVGTFVADKTFDPLKAPLSSFMKIMKGSAKKGPMTVNYEEDKIIIVLSEEDYDSYHIIRNYARSTIHSALVLPALVDVLYAMQMNKSDYEDKPWYGKLQQILVQRRIDVSDTVTAAQTLLGQPITRTLKEINTNAERDSED